MSESRLKPRKSNRHACTRSKYGRQKWLRSNKSRNSYAWSKNVCGRSKRQRPHYSPVKPGRRPWRSAAHTPCYDEHGQELDYHDDVPAATDSQECKSWFDYFRQQGDEYGVQLANSLDAEHRLLQGPTVTSTVSEEAVLLEEEMPTVDMRQFLAGLETLTPAMLSEVSTRMEHLRQLAAPLVSTKLIAKRITSSPSRPTRPHRP